MNSNKSGFFTALGVETTEILATIGARKKEEGEIITPPANPNPTPPTKWFLKLSLSVILIKIINFILFT